jgi:hypothetical protein
LDLWSPGFDVSDVVVEVVVEDWLVPLAAAPLLLPLLLADAPASELALDADPSFPAALSELFRTGGGLELLLLAGAVLSRARLAGGLLSDCGGEASALFGGGGGGGAARESFGVFWLTRFPNRSFAEAALARASHAGAD